MNLAGDPAVLMRFLADTVCEAFGQGITENRVKFQCIRQPKPRKYALLVFYADQIFPALLLYVRMLLYAS